MDHPLPAANPITDHDHRIAVGIGLLLAAIYFTCSAFHFLAIDEIASFALTRSLLSHGATDVDILAWVAPLMNVFSVTATGLDGHVYALKDIGPSILMIPLAGLGYLLHVSPVRLVYLFPILVTALTASLIYLAIRAQSYKQPTAILGCLTYGLASMAFPYARLIFTQPVAALGLFVALWAAIRARTDRRVGLAALSGLGLGLAALSAAPVWATGPICLACLVFQRKPSGAIGWLDPKDALRLLAAWGAGAGLCAGLQAAYNAARFGSAFETGHELIGAELGFTSIGLGSWGQLISTPRGIVWFAPFVLLIPFSVRIGWRRRDRDVQLLGLLVGATLLLVYSAYFNWSGGLAFGPRFLVTLMPELALMVVPLLDHFLGTMRLWQRLMVGAVLADSALTELGGSLLDYSHAESHIYKVLDSLTPPPGFFAYSPELFYPKNLIQAHLITAIRRGWWDVLWMSRGAVDGLLLAADCALIVAAVACLVLVMRRVPARLARGLQAGQILLTLGLIGWALGRYPDTVGYARTDSPPVPGLEETQAQLQAQAVHGDGVIVTLFAEDNLAWLGSPRLGPPDIGLPLEAQLRPTTEHMLDQVPGWYDRVWVISRQTVPGDPQNGIEARLAGRAYAGSEVDIADFRMVPFAFEPAGLALQPLSHSFGGQTIRLLAYASQPGGPGGRSWLNVWLRWQALKMPDRNYTVFVHVLGSSGQLIAQHDSPPQANYAPTLTWTPGLTVDDRHSLRLPDNLTPGDYSLAVGLYDSLTGEPVSVDGQTADSLMLAPIHITADAR